MKVTAVKTYVVHPGWRKNLIFVKVETDAGIHGWGEAYSQYDRDRAVAAQLEALGLDRRGLALSTGILISVYSIAAAALAKRSISCGGAPSSSA